MISERTSEYEIHIMKIMQSKTLKDLFTETLAAVSRQKQASQFIMSGFRGLDGITGGFFPGELVVFGSRPAMGKTQLMVNLALHIGISYPILYISFDLSPITLSARFISAITKIPVQKILSGKLDSEEYELVKRSESTISDLKIFVNDSGYNSMNLIQSHITDHCDNHGTKLVIIDYLQLMNIKSFRGNRDQEISYVCRELKNTAKELDICIILVSQLNRGTEYRGGSKRPMLYDLRDSGSIEEDADKVILLYRPEYYHLTQDENGISTKGIMDLVVAKNRSGSLGTIKLMADTCFTSFSDYDDTYKDLKISQERLSDLDIPF